MDYGHGCHPACVGNLPGTHLIFAGEEWWFYGNHIRPGDHLKQDRTFAGYKITETAFAGPTMFANGAVEFSYDVFAISATFVGVSAGSAAPKNCTASLCCPASAFSPATISRVACPTIWEPSDVAACSACHQLTLVSVVAEVIVIRSRDLLRGRHQPKLQRVRRNGFHHGQTRPC